ncbi:MAG: hypothetical protein Q8K43_06720 [Sulfurimicrobium sp.]|jgi:hypothetical protein|nr:hypothetical protein [Sulfurimicrobium sp.]MDO9190972.1 hypothetical protein [Sulfurimicrobium sp.]MDP1704137.1 hypothetical protein [Sulfurimicrobium sp.]MDP1897560.1 hypothetical protein [Sulfurimicrobium sp.]MDP2199542.1 hypothetical protein [Sulfurimicrobium sp.]
MSEQTTPAKPEYRRLEGPLEYEQAIDTIIRQASHQLRIFDYDLRNQGYNSPQRFELLQNFLLANRTNQVTIVLHDTRYLASECPRMVNLIRQFSHAINVYQTTAEARVASDPFIIADDAHFLHRFHYEHPRAALSLHDKEAALDLIRRFNEIMELSEPAAPATTLGL